MLPATSVPLVSILKPDSASIDAVFLFEFVEDGTEAHDLVTFVEPDAFFFVELHSVRAVLVIDPDMAVGIDDTVEGDGFLTILPGFG